MAFPPITSPFIWGKGGQALTPDQVAQQRGIAEALMQNGTDTSPVGHWSAGAARMVDALNGVMRSRRASKAESEGMASADELVRSNPTLSSYLGGDQQAPQGVQQPGAQIVDALASQQGGNFPASLIQSESGGNWNALNSEGYGGRLQFGEARLADAARAGIIPAGVTGAQFSQMSPEQQQAVENWHFSDIDSQAERMGLNRFLGQNVGGTQVTQNGIRAMAHLGGIGGAKRFLESGGQHNPADSNGTSLGKYLAQHGGGMPGAAPAGPSQAPNSVVAALAQASSNPWVQKKYGPVIEALMGQEMQRSNAQYQQELQMQDPYRQEQLRQLQLENQALLDPQSAANSRVQSSDILDDGTVVTVMSNGTPQVVSPTGEVLTGQAAADAVKAARAYSVDNQRQVYQGRREGTLDADIDKGAAAAGAQEAGKTAITMGREAYESAGKVRTAIGNIDEAIAAIDAGASSGVMAKYLPNVSDASASLNNAANKMGLDIIGATTFGALSEGEMAFALETAMPRNLEPAALRDWLSRKRDAQEKAMITLMDAASFLSSPGNTLEMWIGRNQQQPIQGQTQGQAQAAPGAAQPAKRRIYDPATGGFK